MYANSCTQICRSDTLDNCWTLTIRVSFLAINLFLACDIPIGMPLILISYSYLGLALSCVYPAFILVCHCKQRTDSADKYENEKLPALTETFYEISLMLNILIVLVFWLFLIPFIIYPNMYLYNGISTRYRVEFLLMHIMPIVMHGLELAFNNIKVVFSDVVLPMAFVATYGVVMAVPLLSGKEVGYPSPQGQEMWLAVPLVIVCAGIIVAGQFVVSLLTRNKTYQYNIQTMPILLLRT